MRQSRTMNPMKSKFTPTTTPPLACNRPTGPTPLCTSSLQRSLRWKRKTLCAATKTLANCLESKLSLGSNQTSRIMTLIYKGARLTYSESKWTTPFKKMGGRRSWNSRRSKKRRMEPTAFQLWPGSRSTFKGWTAKRKTMPSLGFHPCRYSRPESKGTKLENLISNSFLKTNSKSRV